MRLTLLAKILWTNGDFNIGLVFKRAQCTDKVELQNYRRSRIGTKGDIYMFLYPFFSTKTEKNPCGDALYLFFLQQLTTQAGRCSWGSSERDSLGEKAVSVATVFLLITLYSKELVENNDHLNKYISDNY